MTAEHRIIFQAINGVGLGHLSRSIAIALAVRERKPHANIFFAVEGSSHGLLEAVNLPYVSIPPFEYIERDASKPIPQMNLLSLSFAGAVVQTLKPDLIVFDCIPNFAFITAARQSGVPFAICARKVKEMTQFLKSLVKEIPDVQMVLIPHTSDEIVVPIEIRKKTRFVGQIARPFSSKQNETPDPAYTPRIVITGGGGGYSGTVDFYNTALTAFANCRLKEPGLTGLLVTGPLFQDWHRLKPVEGIRIIPFDPHLTETFASADLVICQAGYNTIAEIVALSVPAISVPARRKFDDQYERAIAADAANRQIRVSVDPSPESLAGLMREMLMAPRTVTPTALTPPGAALAAELLIASIDDTRSRKSVPAASAKESLSGD